MVYLPGYNLGWPDKCAELWIKIADTIAWNLNIYDLHFISVIVTKKRVLTKPQSTIDTGPSLNTVSSRFTSICLLNCLLVTLSVCHENKKVTSLLGYGRGLPQKILKFQSPKMRFSAFRGLNLRTKESVFHSRKFSFQFISHTINSYKQWTNNENIITYFFT